jgi:hypothetical protein
VGDARKGEKREWVRGKEKGRSGVSGVWRWWEMHHWLKEGKEASKKCSKKRHGATMLGGMSGRYIQFMASLWWYWCMHKGFDGPRYWGTKNNMLLQKANE